jgi:predicted alpha/beta superfamily hydrolase
VLNPLRLATATLFVAIAACGGGGGGGTTASTPPSSSAATRDIKAITSAHAGITYGVQISLPAGYAESTRRYPVVYIGDAEGRFVPLANIVEGQRRPVILVAIGNMGADRRWIDFTMPGAAAYYRFLTLELLPMIDAAYRTDPAQRIYSGHSLGGEFTMYALYLEQPNQRYFSAFISEEGSFWFDSDRRLQSVLGAEPAGQMERDMLARGRDLPVTLVMAGDSQGNGSLVSQLYEHITQRGYTSLRTTSLKYSLGHVPMDNPAFTDALAFVLGPPPTAQ